MVTICDDGDQTSSRATTRAIRNTEEGGAGAEAGESGGRVQ